MKTARFGTAYMDEGLFDLEGVIERAKEDLKGIKFDTLVGTGFSGGVVIPALALAMSKHYVLIRKESDDSHHGRGRAMGMLGERWLFVDDFVGSGRTRWRVIERVRDAAMNGSFQSPHTTIHVGTYLYVAAARGNQGFFSADSYPHQPRR